MTFIDSLNVLTAKARQEALKPAGNIICPSCKTENARGMHYCGGCGAELKSWRGRPDGQGVFGK